MCGAFVVSYATAAADAERSAVAAHLSFAAGKTLSYTVIGALFGAVGAVVAFTPLLPMMLHEGSLSLQMGGWLATANYLGYFAGAMLCAFHRSKRGVAMLRAGLVVTIWTLLIPVSFSRLINASRFRLRGAA